MKTVLLLVTLYVMAFGQTPFILTKLQSVYPLVEIHTDKVPPKYKAKNSFFVCNYS